MHSVPARDGKLAQSAPSKSGKNGAPEGCATVPLPLEVFAHCQEPDPGATVMLTHTGLMIRETPADGAYEAYLKEMQTDQLAGKLAEFPGADAVKQCWAYWAKHGLTAKNPLLSCIEPPAEGVRSHRALVLGCLRPDSPCRALLNDYQSFEVWGVDVRPANTFGVLVKGVVGEATNHYADVASGRFKLFQCDCASFVQGCTTQLFDTIHMEARCSVWVSEEVVGRNGGGEQNGAPEQCLDRKFVEGLFRSIKHGGVLIWNLLMFDKYPARANALKEGLGEVGFTVVKMEMEEDDYFVGLKPAKAVAE